MTVKAGRTAICHFARDAATTCPGPRAVGLGDLALAGMAFQGATLSIYGEGILQLWIVCQILESYDNKEEHTLRWIWRTFWAILSLFWLIPSSTAVIPSCGRSP